MTMTSFKNLNQIPERMKKIPETKARMVRWGRMWPMLLRTKPMNMKKRLTRGKGVEERIISGRGIHQSFQAEAKLNIHFSALQHVFLLTATSHTRHEVVNSCTFVLVSRNVRSFLSSPLFCSAFAVLGNHRIGTAPPFLSCSLELKLTKLNSKHSLASGKKMDRWMELIGTLSFSLLGAAGLFIWSKCWWQVNGYSLSTLTVDSEVIWKLAGITYSMLKHLPFSSAETKTGKHIQRTFN